MSDKKTEILVALQRHGFDFKTKAFRSYVNCTETFPNFFDALWSIGLSVHEAKVYALIMSNSHLNGSTIKLGRHIYRAYPFLRADIEARKEMFRYWMKSLRPSTVKRWEAALRDIDQIRNPGAFPKPVSEYVPEASPADAPAMVVTASPVLYREMTLAQIEIELGYKIKLIS